MPRRIESIATEYSDELVHNLRDCYPGENRKSRKFVRAKDRLEDLFFSAIIHLHKCGEQQNYLNGTARLRSTEGTFTVHKIYGDGNCMFRAVSFILWGTEEEHHSLRALVVHHIVDHWHEHAPFVMAEWNISNPQEYLDFMKNEGVFASELECIVATKLYGLNLSIYRSISDHDVKRVFHNRVSINQETARLLFTGHSDSGHYDVLFLES